MIHKKTRISDFQLDHSRPHPQARELNLVEYQRLLEDRLSSNIIDC
jgi:hypothetical protein